jgi:hypothetical protein
MRRERTLVQAAGVLKSVHLVGETDPFFEVKREAETLRLTIAPRDPVPPEARLVIGDRRRPFEKIITARRKAYWSGRHDSDGVYLLAGPGAANASLADSLHVVDVAPTLAAILGMSVSPHWEGRPTLTGLKLDDVEIASWPTPGDGKVNPISVTEELKEKLRSMGYLE